MQLADLGYEQSPPSEAEVLEAFELATGSSSQLSAADKLIFLQRKLEFLEDFGSDVLKVQEAFDEYSKMAKAQELAASKKRPAEEPQETPEKKPKPAEVNGAADAAAASAAQAIAAATSSAAADATAQYNYAQQWGSYPQAAYNYQQAWNAYPASSYYPTH